MTKTDAKVLTIFLISMILFTASGCTGRRLNVGDLVNESQSVALGDADSVDVEILMGAGELDVTGDGSILMQADFTYNVADLKPEVKHSDGSLSVLTPDIEGMTSFWDMDDYRYAWDLRFNNDVPMIMGIHLGAGRADLKLGDLSLTRLDLDTGAGEVDLDLHGSSALTRLDLMTGVGEVAVDLTGDWQSDLDADIQAGVGELTLSLPRIVCVRVDIEGGLNDTNATGLTKDGNVYVNNACGQSEVTLHIDIIAGIGSINLNLGD